MVMKDNLFKLNLNEDNEIFSSFILICLVVVIMISFVVFRKNMVSIWGKYVIFWMKYGVIIVIIKYGLMLVINMVDVGINVFVRMF